MWGKKKNKWFNLCDDCKKTIQDDEDVKKRTEDFFTRVKERELIENPFLQADDDAIFVSTTSNTRERSPIKEDERGEKQKLMNNDKKGRRSMNKSIPEKS